MNNPELFNESNEATYCPEDNKIRLYVGRVPREEYLALKAEGWTSTPKQDCDFVATWSIDHENTALSYAGEIGDEDQSPTDRAADRAERFSGYREKRRSEAVGYADRFESIDPVHGFQSEARAERSAARHERIGVNACNQWAKAEYWQMRTAGVISHAMYRERPAVRMGRIKVIEAEIRKAIASYTPAENAPVINQSHDRCPVCHKYYCKEHKEAEEKVPHVFCGPSRGGWWAEVADLPKIKAGYRRFIEHSELRLAYEKQMIEAVGGMAGEDEISVGGRYDSRLVYKVNKSNATGRVTTIEVISDTKGESGKYRVSRINLERKVSGNYTPPIEGDTELVNSIKEEIKKLNTKKNAPLINPTMESARKIQQYLNDLKVKSGWCSEQREEEARNTEPIEMKQATYSVRSQGEYSHCNTQPFTEFGKFPKYKQYSRVAIDTIVFKLRILDGGCETPDRVIILTDKPQNKLPIKELVPDEQIELFAGVTA